jgi:predicted protein tyrosine phosphatase
VVVLDIPDRFEYMQRELIDVLKTRVARHVRSQP